MASLGSSWKSRVGTSLPRHQPAGKDLKDTRDLKDQESAAFRVLEVLGAGQFIPGKAGGGPGGPPLASRQKVSVATAMQ